MKGEEQSKGKVWRQSGPCRVRGLVGLGQDKGSSGKGRQESKYRCAECRAG